MAYRITSLAGTKKDPNRRGHTHHFLKSGRIRIGTKNLRSGQSMVLSVERYSSLKGIIDKYESLGAIKVQNLGGQEPLQIPAPMPPEPAPAKEKAVEEINIDGDSKEDTSAIVIELKDDAPAEEAVEVSEEAKEEAPEEAPAVKAEEAPAEKPKKAAKKAVAKKPRKKRKEAN